MEVFLSHIESLPPALAIVVGAFIDVWFITGYMFYGFALVGLVSMLYMDHQVTPTHILVAGFLGTMLASVTNYWLGYFFSQTKVVTRTLTPARTARVLELLDRRGLFFLILIGRSITILRPSYMVVLGTLRLSPWRVLLYDAVVAIFWIVFWITVIVRGTDFLSPFLSRLLSII